MQGMTKEKINSFHLALFVYMCELDGTVFSLARTIAENIGTNGWVAILLLSPVAMLNILLYHILFRAGEGRSVFDLLEGTFPKWLLFPFYAILAAHWTWVGAIIGKHFLLIYQTFAFQTTSPTMLLVIYCLIVYTMLIKDIYSVLKAVTVFFIFTCALNLLIPYFFREWKLVRFTTSFFQGAENGHTFHGWLQVYLAFVGFEVLLFLFPQMDKKGRVFRGAYYGHLMITSIYVISVIIAFGFFSFKEVQGMQYPLINTLEYIELPFLNRVENLIFTVFLFTNLVSTLGYSYASKVTLQRIVPKAPNKLLSIFILAAVFAAGSLFRILRDTEEWLEMSLMTEAALSFVMPLVLIPVALYQKKRRKEKGGGGG